MTKKSVSLITRNGNDKATQFPEIAAALRELAAGVKRSLVLDGEIVAMVDDKPARFQELQNRMHVKEPAAIERYRRSSPSAFVVFDMLMDGTDVVIAKPWTARRALLESRVGPLAADRIQITPSTPDNGNALLAESPWSTSSRPLKRFPKPMRDLTGCAQKSSWKSSSVNSRQTVNSANPFIWEHATTRIRGTSEWRE